MNKTREVPFQRTEEIISMKGKENKSIFLRASAFLSMAFLLLSVMFHVMSMNALATKGYEMRSVEKKLEEETQKYKRMLVEEAQLTSLYRIRRVGERLDLEYAQETPEIVYGVESFAFKGLSLND